MENIYNQLNSYLKGSHRFGTNEEIARFLLVHLDQIPEMRLADVAVQCHVSTPSVIRFCRELGYEDYTAFKNMADEYRHDIRSGRLNPELPLELLGTQDAFIASMEQWLDRLRDDVLHTMMKLDRRQVERLAREILQYRYVYLFGAGLSGVLCEHLRIRLARCGKLAVTLSSLNTTVALTPSKKDTLSIVFTQHGRFLGEQPDLLDYLHKNSHKVWLITQEPAQSFRPLLADEIIYLPSQEENIEAEYLNMVYFQELLGEYFRILNPDKSICCVNCTTR